MAERDDYVCPKCGGSTWVIDANGDSQPCECRGQRIRRAKTKGLITTIPRRFSGLTISADGRQITDHGRPLNFAPEIARTVLKYCRTIDEQLERGRGLWLMGDTGTGKTTLAMLVSKAALRGRAHAWRSTRCRGCWRRIRNTFDAEPATAPTPTSSSGSTRSTCCTSTTSAPSSSTEWVLEQLYAIVNERYEDGQRS